MRVSSQRVLRAVLASCLSVAVVKATDRRPKQGDEGHELPIASSTTSQARKLETGKAPPPTAEPTPYIPPVDDDYYYPGYDDYANGGATLTPQPTTTWYPTGSPWPTGSPYPTATLPYYTTSPYPTPGTTTSPYPTPAITKSPYPTPDYTAPPPPTPDSHDVCMYKPLTITVDLDDYNSLVFCCVQGTGDFDVHSAFDFEGCSLVPPPDYYDYPTLAPTPTPPYESAPPTPHPYPAHPPPVDKVIIHLALKTDHYPDQTSFTLQDAASGEYLWDYDYEAAHWQPNSPYHYQVEVDPTGCYYFIIQDSWGDGLASWGGSFELFYAGYLTWYGSMFGKYSSVAVGEGCYVAH